MSRYKVRGIIIALLCGVALVLPFSSVSAEEINPKIELSSSSGLSEIKSAVNGVSMKESGFSFFDYTKENNKYVVTLDKVDYNNDDVSQESKQAIIKMALETITSSNSMSKQDRTRLYNFVAEQDTAVSSLVRQLSTDVDADFATAYSWFHPFSGGVSTILGLFSLLIFVFLALTIITDLSYLAIPPFRVFLDNRTDEKPKWVSNEAYMAIVNAEKDTSMSKGYLGSYLISKTKQIILLAICLLYLVSGQIYTLVGWIIDAFQGVLG